MSLTNRLKERVKQEGILKALRYWGCSSYDTVRSLTRDTLLDLYYGGKILDNCKSLYSHLGSNEVYHSDYDALNLIFNYCCPVEQMDVLVDVGCGKGRVLNYWLSRGLKNPLVGLELDPDIASQTAAQFRQRPNVSILSGDAIENLPKDGTLFYFYNPFIQTKVAEFEEQMRQLSQNKPLRVIYYNPKSLIVFQNKSWSIDCINFEQDLGLKRWGRINKFHDLAIISSKE